MIPYYNIHTHSASSEDYAISIYNHTIGASYNDFPDKFSGFYSVGIHPWYISDPQKQLSYLKIEILSDSVVAIGEAGLDKLAHSDMSLQISVFEFQARLAEEIKKPLIIHCVKSWEELIRIYKRIRPVKPWIIHGFRGNRELAVQLLNIGFKLSFGKYFNPEALQVAWPHCLFVETDDNDIRIEDVYDKISSALFLDRELFKRQIQENVKQTFSI